MKKKILFLTMFGAAVIALIISGIFFFRPIPVLSPTYTAVKAASDIEYYESGDVKSTHVEYEKSEVAFSSVEHNGVFMNDKIDPEKFAGILSRYECRRTFDNPFPYPSADRVWQIDYNFEFRPVHIVLGKDSVRYESAGDLIVYKILDAKNLMAELSAAIK